MGRLDRLGSVNSHGSYRSTASERAHGSHVMCVWAHNNRAETWPPVMLAFSPRSCRTKSNSCESSRGEIGLVAWAGLLFQYSKQTSPRCPAWKSGSGMEYIEEAIWVKFMFRSVKKIRARATPRAKGTKPPSWPKS